MALGPRPLRGVLVKRCWCLYGAGFRGCCRKEVLNWDEEAVLRGQYRNGKQMGSMYTISLSCLRNIIIIIINVQSFNSNNIIYYPIHVTPPNVVYGWDFNSLGIRIQSVFLHCICLTYLFSFILEHLLLPFFLNNHDKIGQLSCTNCPTFWMSERFFMALLYLFLSPQ